jgi:ATF/CREB family transcription factor
MQHQDINANRGKRISRKANGSLGSIEGSAQEGSDDQAGQAKLNTRTKGKKNSVGKATQASNGRRKADDTPSKGPNKRSKGNNGAANVDPYLEQQESDDDDEEEKHETHETNGRKMTEEEKRKNFLERNRYVLFKTANSPRSCG